MKSVLGSMYIEENEALYAESCALASMLDELRLEKNSSIPEGESLTDTGRSLVGQRESRKGKDESGSLGSLSPV